MIVILKKVSRVRLHTSNSISGQPLQTVYLLASRPEDRLLQSQTQLSCS
jgi:hypothetical protein